MSMYENAENIKLLFAAVQDMKQQIGELQLQVQKLETGHRDDEEPHPRLTEHDLTIANQRAKP